MVWVRPVAAFRLSPVGLGQRSRQLGSPAGDTAHELACDYLGWFCQVVVPEGCGVGQLVGQSRRDPTGPCPGLGEVGGSEDVSFDQVEDVGVDRRSARFYQIQGEIISRFLIQVEDPEARVEPDGYCSDTRFGLEKGVQIVEDSINRVDCPAT